MEKEEIRRLRLEAIEERRRFQLLHTQSVIENKHIIFKTIQVNNIEETRYYRLQRFYQGAGAHNSKKRKPITAGLRNYEINCNKRGCI